MAELASFCGVPTGQKANAALRVALTPPHDKAQPAKGQGPHRDEQSAGVEKRTTCCEDSI